VAVLDGDLGEGDAGGGAVAGGEHPSEVQCGVAVLEIELVHGGGELIAVAGLFEERCLHFGFGDEIAQGDADEERLLVVRAGGGLLPAALQGFEEREGVLAGAEAGFHSPSGLRDAAEVLLYFFRVQGLFAREGVLDGDGEGAGEEFLHAQAHRGLMEEFVGDRPGSFGRTVLGCKDVGMAERFLELGGDGRAVVASISAAEPVVHAVAPDGVEEGMHAGSIQGQQIGHSANALGIEADLGARSDAGKVAEDEVGDGVGELTGKKADEAVGFLHIAGDLGEVAIGGHADGATEGLADVVFDGLLDGQRDLPSGGWIAFAAQELADHLVDAGRVRDRADSFDGGNNFVGIFRVGGVVAVDEDDAGAEALGFADAGSGLDAESFGFVAGRDEGGGVGDGGDDADGFIAEFGVELLLDGREEAVEVDVEEGEEVGLSGRAHSQDDYIRRSFALVRLR